MKVYIFQEDLIFMRKYSENFKEYENIIKNLKAESENEIADKEAEEMGELCVDIEVEATLENSGETNEINSEAGSLADRLFGN